MRWRDWPETRELVDETERLLNLNKLGKHGYPGVSIAERIQLLRYQNSLNSQWRRLRLRLHYNGWRTMFEKASRGAVAGTWNGMIGRRALFLEAARRAGCKTLYFEDAPLPGFAACDPQGINYGNSLPRQASFYRQWADSRPSERRSRRWRELASRLPQRPAKRPQSYADSCSSGRQAPAGRFLYCPLQVPADTQVWAFGGWIESMDRFIEVVYRASRALPAGWHLRIREHPSSRRSFGKKLRALQDERFVLWNQGDSKSQIETAEAIVTLNSSVGLHGFLFDKPVIVLGQAYWSFGALTTRVKCAEALCETFFCPTNLDYDDAVRSDFMNYLTQEYLIRIPDGDMRKPFDLASEELAKVAKHLQKTDT